MAKTTNILDLNNRLEKVEKENVAQNSYTSLKNKPKINNVTLTGNKSLADIGAAAASDLTTLSGDVGDKTQLNTTDKSSTVAAINEVNSAVNSLNRGGIFSYPVVSVNNVAAMTLPKANSYTITNVSIFGGQTIPEATGGVTDGYEVGWVSATEGFLILKLVGTFATVNVGNILSVFVEIQ